MDCNTYFLFTLDRSNKTPDIQPVMLNVNQVIRDLYLGRLSTSMQIYQDLINFTANGKLKLINPKQKTITENKNKKR